VTEEDLERYFNEIRGAKRAPSTGGARRRIGPGMVGVSPRRGVPELDPMCAFEGGRRGRTLPKPLAEEEIITLLDSIPADSGVDLRDRSPPRTLIRHAARDERGRGRGSFGPRF